MVNGTPWDWSVLIGAKACKDGGAYKFDPGPNIYTRREMINEELESKLADLHLKEAPSPSKIRLTATKNLYPNKKKKKKNTNNNNNKQNNEKQEGRQPYNQKAREAWGT